MDEGPPTPLLPARKRQGTVGTGERKRLKVASIASERERSEVDEAFAEGREYCKQDAKEHPIPEPSSFQPEEPTNSDTNKVVFLLDIFSGTAGVTAAFIQMGDDALGLDHVIDKGRVKGPVSKIDLCKKENQDLVFQWLEKGKADAVMLAPPCGTSSRAREIPIKDSKGRSKPAPPPLRSRRHPNGLPSLRGLNALKVKLANKLYQFTRRVIDACCSLGIPFVCENLQRSWMWETSFFRELPLICRFQCMYGGNRLKKTAFLMNFEATNLLQVCDGSHSHLPWGKTQDVRTGAVVFSTSTEAEYPWLLCKQLAQAFFLKLQQLGKISDTNAPSMDASQRMGSGQQPRGKLAPLLVADYKFRIQVRSHGIPVPREITAQVPAPFQGIPISSKLISSRVETLKGEGGEKKDFHVSEFGVYRSPAEFMSFASTPVHPLDSPQMVDPSNLKAILAIRDWSHSEVASFRAKKLKYYIGMVESLASEEKVFRGTMDGQVNEVLAGKRLLVFKQMCADANVGDETLFEELTNGFRLTGRMHESGKFPKKLRPAGITVEQLRESSVWARKIFSSTKKVAADPEIASAVYDETQQQLQDGWVKGPFSDEQLDRKFPKGWVPSKRFGVRQGGKIRAVDDFSEFLVNLSVTSTEKVALYGIDEVVNTARSFMCSKSLSWENGGNVRVDDSFDPSKGPWVSLKGRALDLKSAYKQLARHPDDA